MKIQVMHAGRILFLAAVMLIISSHAISSVKTEASGDSVNSTGMVHDSYLEEGKYDFPNPNPTRYLFGFSAFNLKKGEGYYQNTYLFLNSFQVGLTDNISVGGGFELISTVISSANGEKLFSPSLFITPKAGFKIVEKLYAGFGAILAWAPAIIDRGPGENYAGLLYGVATYGTDDANVTAGLGWGFAESLDRNTPAISVSGLKRVGSKIAIVSENWFVPYKVVHPHSHNDGFPFLPILSLGIRILNENFSVDLGLLGIPICVPYVDFVVRF